MLTCAPSVSRFSLSCRSARLTLLTSALWLRLFSRIRSAKAFRWACCTLFSPFVTSAARSSLPAAIAATSRLCFKMPSKTASASVISGWLMMSPIIRPASSTLASSYSAASANRLIILGLMVSCTFISTSSHSVLSMLAAPATPASCAAERKSAAALSFTPPTARVPFTMDSYCSAGLPSRYPSACRSFTPWRRASATASVQLPYRFTSSALALPFLSTV